MKRTIATAFCLFCCLFLTGCPIYYGMILRSHPHPPLLPICNTPCQTTPDNKSYVLKYENDFCADRKLVVPIKYAQCTQCSGNGNMSVGVSYPDFEPLKDTQKKEGDELSSRIISINLSRCPAIDSSKTRSEKIRVYIERLFLSNSKYDNGYLPPEYLGNNYYVIRNHKKIKSIYYYMEPDGRYVHYMQCHSRCFSFHNHIDGFPYSYNYHFYKPENEEDIIKIHQDVKDFVSKAYRGELE